MTTTKERAKVERTCAYTRCGRSFDAATDYSGHPHAPVRKYHAPNCAAMARNDVRRERAAHDRQYAALEEMHELEAEGQLSLIDEALPSVPERPNRRAS